ncbi:hypothetical protein G6F32_017100 [Rhizopus arrhizus]|nr:hypothetical protein G6F32_017100 [Rhizopus arrhizus]
MPDPDGRGRMGQAAAGRPQPEGVGLRARQLRGPHDLRRRGREHDHLHRGDLRAGPVLRGRGNAGRRGGVHQP